MRVYWFNYVNIDFRHQYGISITEAQTSLLVKRPKWRAERQLFWQATVWDVITPSFHWLLRIWSRNWVKNHLPKQSCNFHTTVDPASGTGQLKIILMKACTTDKTKYLVMSICEPVLESLFWGPHLCTRAGLKRHLNLNTKAKFSLILFVYNVNIACMLWKG